MNLSCPQLTISHVMLHFLKQILSTTEIYGVPAGARHGQNHYYHLHFCPLESERTARPHLSTSKSLWTETDT